MHKNKRRQHHFSFFSTLFHKPLLFLFLLFFLPFMLWGIQQTQQVVSFGKNIAPQSNSYGSIDPIEGYPAGDPPPEQNPDLNPLVIRGYVHAAGEKYPIDLSNGEIGVKTPQIGKILDNIPIITSVYKINSWVGDFKSGHPGDPMPLPGSWAESVLQIQMIGLQTYPGQSIKVPPVYGNPISPEYNAMVLFANDRFITLKYTREDNIGIKNGYAIQIDGLAVDPNLLQLYKQLNASGRGNLPAVSNEQIIGTAQGDEIRVVIRDTGNFLDPRSKLDWWQGVDYPSVPTDIIQKPTAATSPKQTQSPIDQPTPTSFTQTLILPSAAITNRPLPTTNPLPTRTQATVIYNPPNVSPPTLTPVSKPLINIGKTMKNAQSFWDLFLIKLNEISKQILP